MTAKQKSFLSVSFIMATLSMLCQNVSTQMLNTTLSPFANFMWNSKTLGGLLTSFFNIGSIVMAFFSAPLIARIGKKKSIVIFSLLYAVSTVLFIIMPKENVTLFARMLQGIGKGVITVACASVISDVTPPEKMNEGMGIFGLGSTFAMAFGPMIALNAVGENNRFSLMFTICASVIACGALFALFIRKDVKTETEEKKDDGYRGVQKLIEFKALLPSFNYTCFFASFACVLVFSTVYAQEILELSSGQISMFYLVAAVTMLVVRLFGGRMADRYGELVMIVPGHLCIMALLAILYFAKAGDSAFTMFMICGALYGVGNASVQPSMNAIAVVDAPEGRSAVANATFYFMMDFGILFSSSVFGKVIDKAVSPLAGYQLTYLCSGIICLFSMLMAVVFLNRKARSRRRQR